MRTKYIFVSGGVVSGLGKGITAASLGRLLKGRGYRVSMQKLDPYINAEPGLMSPYQHGEVFVMDDGARADLDLGHYERFIDENLTVRSCVTTGKVYATVLAKERQGVYEGGTIQVIPHITDEIKKRIRAISEENDTDIAIIEIGGTVGDIESQPHLEAIRQMRAEEGNGNVCFLHVTLIPYLNASGELKTKPTQHSVKELRSIGIQADVLVCRSEIGVSDEQKGKIALFCNVAKDCVIINRTQKSIYEVPLALEREGLARVVLRKLGLEDRPVDLAEWEDVVKRNAQADKKVKIALVGKYVELKDAYLSAEEALTHAGIEIGAAIELVRVQPDKVCEDNVAEKLTGVQGIIVPGGAGERGANGVVAILKYAREHKIPYLGLAYGMQMAVVEYAKNVAGILGAQSQELDLAGVQPVVYAPQGSGGEPHARIGKYDSVLDKSSRLFKAYGYQTISERHNHNYEINPAFSVMLSDAGLKIVGNDEENGFIDAMELTNHPFYVIAQFQPEFRSRPNKPHPLYIAFVNACLQAYALESAT